MLLSYIYKKRAALSQRGTLSSPYGGSVFFDYITIGIFLLFFVLTMPTKRTPQGTNYGCATRDYMLLALSNQFCISSSAWYAFHASI